MAEARNAQAEAAAALGADWKPLVLEPSPPAILDEPFADDPPVGVTDDATVVSPVERAGSSSITWTSLVEQRPDLAEFAADRWLANWHRLTPLPPGFAFSRLGLHRVGAYLMSPARRQANGKIGLRYTMGGFGTPFFVAKGDDPATASQVRVVGAELVHQKGDEARATRLTTLNEVGAFLGLAPDVEWASTQDIPQPGGLDEDLGITDAGAAALASWFGFGYSVLEQIRADEESVAASNPQLWPEHFDPAIEIGSDEARKRASYGVSPGDGQGADQSPYLFISTSHPDALGDDAFWNSDSFPGARLSYDQFLAAEDQRLTALDFFRTGRRLLLR